MLFPPRPSNNNTSFPSRFQRLLILSENSVCPQCFKPVTFIAPILLFSGRAVNRALHLIFHKFCLPNHSFHNLMPCLIYYFNLEGASVWGLKNYLNWSHPIICFGDNCVQIATQFDKRFLLRRFFVLLLQSFQCHLACF